MQMESLKNQVRRARHIYRSWKGRDVHVRIQDQCEKVCLGNDNANWCVCPSLLSEESVVYSIGVGTDISFDLELIRRFGTIVHAFDPTPRSIAWLQSQRLPEKFVFHDYGLGVHDGNLVFHPPENSNFVSYSVFSRGSATAPAVEAPVCRLATIMKRLGHTKIDLLKMDIEGAEYDVLSDLLASGAPVQQLLVEFHHRWKDVGPDRTKSAIQYLNRAGFRIFHVSASGEEYSFIKI
jgi:FkbM family methyltransferase